jgi:glycosyltransferase involved in cell wall biosynthesis
VRANFSIDRVQPGWCRQFYSILRDALPPLGCSAIVYGNERGFSADVLVTDAARILGIPTVAELLNLYVHKDVLPTVLVAPSTFAVEHDSIQTALREKYSVPAPKKLGENSPRAVVIPPSVDTRRFDPSIYRARKFPPQSFVEEGVYAHPSCRTRGNIPLDASGRPVRPCIIVGFIARLSPGELVTLISASRNL